MHVSPILISHLKIILATKSKFVGTKALCQALRTVQTAVKFRGTRAQIQDHINSILYEISLPLMMLSESDMILYQENPIEYVRLQVDAKNPYNYKTTLRQLVH